MKSRYAGHCHLCELQWDVGDSIGKLLGKWVHEDCKAAEIAARTSLGGRQALPDARGSADKKNVVSSRRSRSAPRASVVATAIGEGVM